MAKVSKGRLDSVWGMRTFTAAELYALADEMELEMRSANFSDDPKWQRRRIDRVRELAAKKEASMEHKHSQR